MDTLQDVDSTEVLKMERDFQNFVSGSARLSTRKKPTNFSGVRPLELDDNTSFDNQRSRINSSSMCSSGQVTLGSLMEKEKEVRRRQAELVKAKATIAELENKIVNVETTRKRQRIEYEQDIDTVKQDAYNTKDKVEELKSQLRKLVKKEEEARREVDECRQQLSSTKTSLGGHVSDLRRQKIELEAKLDEMEGETRSQIMQLKKDKMRQETEMEICRSEKAEAQDQLACVQRRCNELKTVVKELEEYRSKALDTEIKAKELQTTLNNLQDDALITKSMKTQLARLADLETENRKLRDENTFCKNTKENVLLLREELQSANHKLERATARASETEKLRATCEDLQERLQKWESCHVPGSNRPRSPTEMSRQIADLQKTSLLTLEKQGELQGNERLMAQQLKTTQEEVRFLKEKLVAEQTKCGEHNDFIKRIQRKLLLLKRERDGYKHVLDSYDSEAVSSPETRRGSPSPASQTRIKQLEDTLSTYRNHMAQLEKQRDDAVNANVEANRKVTQLQVELQNTLDYQPVAMTSEIDQKNISTLREQVAEVEKELQRVSEERDTLAARIEQRHLQGDFDPTKTRVVHMTMNPTSMAMEQRRRELSRLREENKVLQARLKLLEESGGQVDDLTVKVQHDIAQPSSSEELEAMKASLITAELKNKRLMEAFKKKSHEFREACFQLLGYKIDIPTDKQYRLMNIYAEGPEEILLFQQDNEGVVQLLSNDYSSTLTEQIDTYLAGANSIPAFLSSITLMLFNRQTMLQQSMVTT